MELFSGEQFNSFHPVFIIFFFSPRCTVTRGKGTVKESKFELHVVKTNQGHLSQRHQGQKQNVINKISTILGRTQSKYHTTFIYIFLSLSHFFVLYFSVYLHYSIHVMQPASGTDLDHISCVGAHFSVPVRVQQVLQMTDKEDHL